MSAPSDIVAFAKDWHEDPDLEPPRPARAGEDAARAVAELGRDADAQAVQSGATSARSRASSASSPRAAQRRERPVGVHPARAAASPTTPAPAGSTADPAARDRPRTARASRHRDFQLWTFLPNVGGLRRHARRVARGLLLRRRVVACSATSTRDGTVVAERALLEGSTACSRSTRRSPSASARSIRRRTSASHGVDHALFARALDPDTRVPADLAALPRPSSASTARCGTGSTSS